MKKTNFWESFFKVRLLVVIIIIIAVYIPGRSSAFDSKMKLRRLLEVKSVLVEEYAGDVRTRINDLAE